MNSFVVDVHHARYRIITISNSKLCKSHFILEFYEKLIFLNLIFEFKYLHQYLMVFVVSIGLGSSGVAWLLHIRQAYNTSNNIIKIVNFHYIFENGKCHAASNGNCEISCNIIVGRSIE